MAAIGQLLHKVKNCTVHIQVFICFLRSHPVLDTGMIEVLLYLNENMCFELVVGEEGREHQLLLLMGVLWA